MIIHDYKSDQGLDVFSHARILLSYERDERHEAQVQILLGLSQLESLIKKYRKDFKL